MENIRSAHCLWVVFSKLLAAHKANFLSLLVLAKKSQSSHAREWLQRPFVTPSSPNGSSRFYSPEERKEKSCFLCACYLLFDPHYQQQNNWRWSDRLVEDFFLLVIKSPRTSFNNKLLPSCSSSKFSSSFRATSVLLCALLDPILPDRNYSKGDSKLF